VTWTPNLVEQIELLLKREGGGLGLSIAGGKGSTPFVEEDDGIFISRVTPNGAAARAGVRVGDKLLAVSTGSHLLLIASCVAWELCRLQAFWRKSRTVSC